MSMNVTTTDGTGASYLTVWPADAARPLSSNLNWTAGAAPSPNKVDVKLSAHGQISLYNLCWDRQRDRRRVRLLRACPQVRAPVRLVEPARKVHKVFQVSQVRAARRARLERRVR